MKLKKLLLSSATLSTLIIPLSLSIACSTSWPKWDPVKDPQRPTTDFEHEQAFPTLWKVRQDENGNLAPELLASWNQDAKTLDLNKINNQYELIEMLAYILNFNSPDPIDQYWYWDKNESEDESKRNGYTKMKAYAQNLTTELNSINLFFAAENNYIINWDVIIQKNQIIEGITNSLIQNEEEAMKNTAFSQANIKDTANFPRWLEVDSNGNTYTEDLLPIANAGLPLISKPIVQSLLLEDGNYTMNKLTKLVNLPKNSFNGFSELLDKISSLLKIIYEAQETQNWIKEKELDFNINSNGYLFKTQNSNLGRIQSQFLILTLKN